jgi:hypothetical protein
MSSAVATPSRLNSTKSGILAKKLKSGLQGFRMAMKEKERKLMESSGAQEILA